MMRRTFTAVAMTLLVVSAFLAYAGTATASRFTETADQLRIDCTEWTIPGDDFLFEGTGEDEFDAGTDFWVRHGFIQFPWTVPYDPDEEDTLSPIEKRAFMSPATKFVLLVDGESVISTKYSAHVATWGPFEDVKVNVYISEFRGGMSGTVEFTGLWFYDSSDPSIGGEFLDPFPYARCVFTVEFVEE